MVDNIEKGIFVVTAVGALVALEPAMEVLVDLLQMPVEARREIADRVQEVYYYGEENSRRFYQSLFGQVTVLGGAAVACVYGLARNGEDS